MVQSKLNSSNERIIGRALLIIAYGVASLPQEGLEATEEALDIQIKD